MRLTGLRARITVVVMLVTFVTTILTAFMAYQLQATSSRERFVAAARAGFVSDLRQSYAAVKYRPDVHAIDVVTEYMQDEFGISFTVMDLNAIGQLRASEYDGLLVFGEPYPWVRGARFTNIPASVLDLTAPLRVQEVKSRLVISGVVPGVPVLLVEYFDLWPLRDELSTLRWRLTAVATGVGLLGLGAALLAARHIQRPVRRVAAAARTLGDGTFDVRLPVRGRDELADLVGSFNSMAERLKAKDEQQRRFISDVAHDLRTPVAAMVAAADSLDKPDQVTRARSAELIADQSRRLAKLVDDLLEISRFDAGVLDLRCEPVDLPDLVADAIAVATADVEVAVWALGDTTIRADPRRLHTVMCNLLANAVHHGAEPITVTVDGTDPANAVITVADSGPGIPADLQPILFDRFVRGDQARRPTEGSGLGLAIARENVLLHHGRLSAHNDSGAVFSVVLPRDHRPD